MINLELLNESESIELELEENSKGGTSNYPDLSNKPQINGNELVGDKKANDLGLVDTETYNELKKIVDDMVQKRISDILINGASIVDENGVAEIPIASEDGVGVVRVMKSHGIKMNTTNNALTIAFAEENNIKNRNSNYNPIVPTKLDYAVKQAMCDGKGAEWTAEEKVMAQERIGLGWKLLGDITVEEDDVAMVEIPIDNPNYNEYQFFITLADRNDTSNRSMMVNFDGLSTNTYALSAFGVGTNKNYSGRGYAQRHCNSGWLTFAVGGTGNLQNATMATNASRANNFSTGSTWDTENPSSISVSLSTGLDIGTRFVVYAR